MLDAFRRNRRLLQFLLLLVIVPSFVIVGAWDMVNPQASSSGLAEVGGRPITQQQWQQAHQRSLDAMSAQFSGQVPVSAFDTPASRVQTLDELIQREVVLSSALRARMFIPDDQLASLIAEVPQFQVDGRYDFEHAKKFLEARGLTTQQFEVDLRSDLMADRLPRAIAESQFGSRLLARRLSRSESESRRLWLLSFPSESFLAKAIPSPQDIEAAYQARSSEFQTSERVDLEWLVLKDPSSAELVEQFSNLVYEQSDSLKPAADALGLRILRFKGLVRDEPLGGSGLSQDDSLVLNHEALRAALFSNDVLVDRRNTESIEVRPGLFVSARVLVHEPAKPLPLSAVSSRIQTELQRETATKLARQAAQQWVDTNRASLSQKPSNAREFWISRSSLAVLQPVIGKAGPSGLRDLGVQLFASDFLMQDPRVVEIGSNFGSFVAVWVESKLPEESAAEVRERVGAIFSSLERLEAQESFTSWVRHQEKVLDVKRYPEKLAASDS
ncbi:MAG: SurA N-terminal domain-containing protein [Bordetella sp.]